MSTASSVAINHFINGVNVDGTAASSSPVYNPATGSEIGQAPVGTEDDVDRAVAAARAALPAWRSVAPTDRASVMRAVADALATRLDEFAEAEATNGGKTLENARGEMSAVVRLVHFYAGVAMQNFGRQIPTSGSGLLCYTVNEPVGVVGAISPWNYPLLTAAGKIAGALAVGCTVVAKPAPETPLTVAMFARLATEAGLPAGVLNVVLGDDQTGAALVVHPDVAKISFTGSTVAGRKVAAAAGAIGRPVVMELGGKSPNIVFDDVDLEASIGEILMGGLYNAGQECCAGQRILVEATIADRFQEAATRWLRATQVGRGPRDAEIGPLISMRQLNRVSDMVDRAIADGAEVVAQAPAPEQGFFFPPTILGNVNSAMEIWREEVFGPVLTIDTFTREDEAMAKANATSYGLAAGVWTRDLGRAIRFANGLESGIVWVNSYLAGEEGAPFGGTKDSGFGREIGVEGALEFTSAKTVYMKAAPGTENP